MSSEQSQDPEELITFIGHTEYADDWSRFYHLVAQGIGQELDNRSQNPPSVKQALVIRSAKTYLGYKEFWEELITEEKIGSFDQDNNWQGLPIPQLADRLEQEVRTDNYERKKVTKWTHLIDAATAKIDPKDASHIQMVVMQDTSQPQFDKSAYAYLVVYPSGQREISFPTAMCHSIDAMALLQEATLITAIGNLHHSRTRSKPQEISVDSYHLKLRHFKLTPSSDEQLLTLINKRGTTIVDKLIQAGLSLRDKAKGIKGEHIDAFRAMSDENWAISYALACHRGVGNVVNAKINLPPVKMSP